MDPAAGPVQRFAFELRKLRQEAGGLSYRAMAQRAGYSVTVLSQAAAGEKLPSLPVLLAYVTACGADPAAWERRWEEAARADTERLPPDRQEEGQAPYQGLTRFEPADHERFFGRGRLVDDLSDVLRRHRCVALVGPSGSGKSSLLRAGLIPLLQRTPDPVLRPAALRVLTPGDHPIGTHGDVLAPAPGSGDTFLVVDQFEEVFTLCRDPGERAAFLDLLLSADAPDSRLRVVLGIRADFYGRCLQHPGLVPVMRRASVPIGPMSPQELREAVVKPAAARGLIVERALTARLVEEVADEPGGLPLLSHVLLETWRRRQGRTLTMGAYEAAGGLHGAIAQTAEHLYAALSPDQRLVARRILLRLITPGQGVPDTRCPVNRSALERPAVNGSETGIVLDRLARARLITLDQDTVDLAHEALITAWPRLRGWLDEGRGRLLLHGRLRQDARTWVELGNDSGSLYRGARLAEAEEAFGSGTGADELTPTEAEFLAAGRAARVREHRRRRSSTAVVTVLVVLSMVAGVVAWQQNREGDQRRAEAASRRLASLAENMSATEPRTAMRLSAAAWRIRPTDEARAALLGAAAQPEQDAFAVPGGRADDVVRLSRDGRTMVVASEAGGRVRGWDVAAHRRTVGFRLPEGESLVDLLPDGRLLTQSEHGRRVRDLSSGKPMGAPVVDPHTDEEALSSTPSGRMVLVQGSTSMALWDLRRERMVFRRGGEQIQNVAVSGDDRYLALCKGRSLEVWDVGPRRRLRTLHTAELARAACRGTAQLDFDPQGRLLLVDEGIRGYDVRTGRKVLEVDHEESLTDVEISSDGRFVVSADTEAILLWRAQSDGYELVHRYRHSGDSVGDLRLDLEQRTIRYLEGDDGANTAVRTLFLGDAVASWRRAPSVGAAFSPDGRQLVTARNERGRARFEVRPTAGGGRAVTLPSADCEASEDSWDFWCWPSLAFSGDGRSLAYGAVALDREGLLLGPQRIKVWDVRENCRPADFVTGAKGQSARSIALNSGGTSVLVLRQEPEPALETWDVRDGTKAARPVWEADVHVRGTSVAPGSGGMVMRPDGRRLATAFGTFALPSGRRTEDTAENTAPLANATALAYRPDGERLAVGEPTGRVSLYDGNVTRRLASLAGTVSGLDSELESADALAYSHDGKTLAVGGDEGTVRLWDAASGRPLGGPLPTAGNAVEAVAFSEDDRTVLVAGEQVPLRSYAIDPERATDTVCERARGGLSRTDWKAYIPDMPYRDIC
ncbi:helix-turn-helix domain-containing protein [Streptomyces sp. NPDC058284]|uniref:nSTAND1 domain-containing NTPase n=1 Tax=unclassified Streptomyces TaxID=2593676 RepID=UPI00365A820B